jgi:hypothetical protein
MATRITDTGMTSNQTRHTAQAAPGGGWTVSWLPGRTLTQNQAVTAMTIAEAVAAHADDLADSASRWWLHVDGWAAELGITGPNAVAEASLSPEDHAGMPRVTTLAPDAQPGRTGYLLALDKSTGTARVRIGGETVTMLATNLQYADCSLCRLRAERGVEPPPGGCTCQADQLDEDEDDEDCLEPYCSRCGATIGIFIGHGDGWRHYRGGGTVESPNELFDAGHEAELAERARGAL